MKVLFVATVVKTHIMEFHIPYLRMFKALGWETAVAARNDYEDPSECIIPYCDHYYNISFERNPFMPANIAAFRQLKHIIIDGEYDIVHCHTPVGGAIGRLAAADSRKKGCKVFYTAHGFHFYKGAPLVNWAFFYPIERILAHMTDVLITINREDFKRARKFKAGRIEFIPGVGVDLEKFSKGTPDQSQSIRAELGIPNDAPVVLSVGEINVNKNHKIIIEAISDIDNARFVLCGQGPRIEELRKLAVDLGIDNRVIFAGYRTDVADFYKMADIFVFPSYREGLPVALMEAMASGLKCIAAKNRGTDDLLPESKWKFNPDDVTALRRLIRKALSEECDDEIKQNRERLNDYDINNVLKMTERIYMSELN